MGVNIGPMMRDKSGLAWRVKADDIGFNGSTFLYMPSLNMRLVALSICRDSITVDNVPSGIG